MSAAARFGRCEVAATFALALMATPAVVAPARSAVGASPRAELRALHSPQVWLSALVAAIGFAGFLAIYTCAAPITTQAAGLSSSVVSQGLAVASIGMTIGNLLGGFAADRDLRASLVLGFSAIVVAGIFFYLAARTPVRLFVGIFLVAATSMFVSAPLQARLIQAAPGAQLMEAAINQSAMNIANSLGPGSAGSSSPVASATSLGSGRFRPGRDRCRPVCVLSSRKDSIAPPAPVQEPVPAGQARVGTF